MDVLPQLAKKSVIVMNKRELQYLLCPDLIYLFIRIINRQAIRRRTARWSAMTERTHGEVVIVA